MKEINLYMEHCYFTAVENSMDDLIRYCRAVQKEFELGDGEISGTQMLYDMTQRGTITIPQLLAILPAVENYDAPYKLNINK